jgi:hypothetical protein
MAYIGFKGSVALSTLTSAGYHLLLSHPSVTDVLVLREHRLEAEVYIRNKVGWPQSSGRNIRGALKVEGSVDRTADEWQLDFLVSRAQADLFNNLLLAQNQTSTSVTLSDRFNGLTDNTTVWLQVDQQYLTPVVMGALWTLQFQALAI